MGKKNLPKVAYTIVFLNRQKVNGGACMGLTMRYLYPWFLFFGFSGLMPWDIAALPIPMAPVFRLFRVGAMGYCCVTFSHGSCSSAFPGWGHGILLRHLFPWLQFFEASELMPWVNDALSVPMAPIFRSLRVDAMG